jgi:hypothetical protein
VAVLGADDFRGQFADHFEMGLIDYNETIENAGQQMTLALFDHANLAKHRANLAAWPLLHHERSE